MRADGSRRLRDGHAGRRAAAGRHGQRRGTPPVWAALTGKMSYPILMPVFGMLVFAFLMVKIIPSFCKDFPGFRHSGCQS